MEPVRSGGRAPGRRRVTIRSVEGQRELESCAALQRSVWGAEFGELVPPGMLNICLKMGGVVAGAFDDDGELVGFVFGISGLYEGELSHWSHMLGVRSDSRDMGLGFRLKAHQRGQLLGAGILTVRWTFDPLESRNAYLNFAKLGVLSREYVPEMYGTSESPLHAHIGTDRLVALWLLDSPRVAGRVERREPPPAAASLAGVAEAVSADVSSDGRPRPEVHPVPPGAERVLVAIPGDIQALKAADPGLALAWRQATRSALSALLDRGMEVQELMKGEEVSRYVLGWPGSAA